MPVKITDKVFSLRLPISMYEFLDQVAKQNKRSVNSEVLLAIEKHIDSIERQNQSPENKGKPT